MGRLDLIMTEIDLRWVGESVYAPGSSFGPYVATCHELVWLQEGRAILTAGGERESLRQGSVALAVPGESLTYVWDDRVTTRHGWIHFSLSGSTESWPRVRHLRPDDVVLSLVTHTSWLERNRPTGWHGQSVEALKYVIKLLVTGNTASGEDRRTSIHPAISRSQRFVEDQWAVTDRWTAPTLKTLAAAAGVTPEYLCRLYRTEFGRGPSEVLRLLRLNRAASLLIRSPYSVFEISQLAGFADQFHFSRAFKTVYGTSPSEFRRSQHLGPDLRREFGWAIPDSK